MADRKIKALLTGQTPDEIEAAARRHVAAVYDVEKVEIRSWTTSGRFRRAANVIIHVKTRPAGRGAFEK